MTDLGWQRFRQAVWTACAVLFGVGVGGCRTAVTPPQLVDPNAAIEALNRPLSGDPAALYRLRVKSSGGLRMSVLTSGSDGRLTIAGPFGKMASLTSWSGSQRPAFFDLREGCQIPAVNLEHALGVAAMPLPQAVRLFVGRLPALDEDWVSVRENGRLLVEGEGWAALITVAPDPFRVVRVEEVGRRDPGWRIELSDHRSSVPGFMRVENPDGRWAELKLMRLEWNRDPELPPLPDLPLCGAHAE